MMRVLVSAVGQHDNVGDTVLRRGLLDALRTIAPLQVYVGDKSDGYLSGLGLHADDLPVRDGAQWRRTVSRRMLGGGAVYAFDTGETEVQASFARRYARIAPLLLINRLRGGVAVQLGVGVREPSRWRHPIAAVLRLCDTITWRDETSRRIMGIGSVTPDWAFALGAPDEVLQDGEHSRPLLAIAIRQSLSHAARDKPDDRWIAAVQQIATSLALQPIVVAQIARDNPLAEELAGRLGCEALPWLDDSHARQEERLRATYRDSAIVLSDRLHAIVIGATEGAVPIALSSGPMDKTTRTLLGAGITGTSVPRALGDVSAVLAVIRDALARRAEIMGAVSDARGRLQQLSADLRTRLAAKGLTAAGDGVGDALFVQEGAR